jgi:hypothetical protein
MLIERLENAGIEVCSSNTDGITSYFKEELEETLFFIIMDVVCPKCQRKLQHENEMEKHNWIYHPSDSYQKSWSEQHRSGFKNCSTYYHDDPYY